MPLIANTHKSLERLESLVSQTFRDLIRIAAERKSQVDIGRVKNA